MPSSYTTNLGFEKQADGENASTWGQKVNTLWELVEDAISDVGAISLTADANKTLTRTDGSVDEARSAVLEVTSTVTLTATRSIVIPTRDKIYIVSNNTSGSQSILVITSGGTGVTIKNGEKRVVYCDGVNVVEAITALASLALDTALPISEGGTGATTASTALSAVGGQPSNAILDDLAALTQAADKLPYFSSTSAATTTTLSSYGRSLIDDADASAARTTLGLGTLATKSTIVSADITDGTVTSSDIKNGTIVAGDLASSVLSGYSTTTQMNTAISTATDSLYPAYPIGAIFTTVTAYANSAAVVAAVGGTTWVSFAAGKMLMGLDSSDSDFNTVEGTGGAKTHTLTTAEMPSHNHNWASAEYSGSYDYGTNQLGNNNSYSSSSGAANTMTTSNTGSGTAHSIMNPYITVYMWKRTA